VVETRNAAHGMAILHALEESGLPTRVLEDSDA
jgi:hypothetical protein